MGPVGILAVLYLGLLFASLSSRLSAVTKQRFKSTWSAVGTGFVAVAAISQILRGAATLAPDLAPPLLLTPWFAVVTFHVPLAIGVSITLWSVWSHWNWILREKIK